ncbi:MAG: hypothetical protein HW386_1983 [Gammaproteobacteria bacterium]|nr:hypothetical protein [Gammaproteobacteria bacterium]
MGWDKPKTPISDLFTPNFYLLAPSSWSLYPTHG